MKGLVPLCLMSAVFVGPMIIVGPTIAQQPAATSTPPAQQSVTPSDAPEWHFGFEMFRMLLEEQGLQPVSDANNILRRPAQSVVVIMGRIEDVVPPRTLEFFCERGGMVLLASDTSNSFGRIGEFQAGPVTSRRPQIQYQNFADCLTITDFNETHPLMENVNSLVVNRSGWLQPPKWHIPDWDVVAQLPLDVSPSKSVAAPLIAEVRVSARASGRMVIAADQSLFTNGMLWHGDNAILAVNISKLLGGGERSQLLFVQDGAAVGSYQNSPMLNQSAAPPKLPEKLPEPDASTLLTMANSVIRNMQESNVLNEALANRPRNVRPSRYRRGLLFALVAAALAFVIWRISANGPLVHRPMPQRDMKTAHALTTDRKVKAAEFGLAASLLSRELCRELTGSHDSSDWQRLLAGNETPAAFSVRKKSQQKQLAAVLELALNSRTVHISRRRFQSIGRSIQQLRQQYREHQPIS
ncbi:MAG: hypothetical protein R3C59_19785 [Planctomycetaceae bacterium]